LRPVTRRCDLLVVSHAATLPVNQLVYARLAQRGFRVELITPDAWSDDYSPGGFEPEPVPDLVGHFHPRRVVLEGRPQRHAYLAPPLAALRRWRPAVLFCEEEPFSVAATEWCLNAWLLGIPFGVQMDENMARRLPAAARVFRRLVLPRAAFVAARSDSAARLAAQWGARGDIRLIPHHVPEWPTRERPRHEAFTVGYAGRLVGEKGLDSLVAAVRRLEPGVDLLVAGNGPLRPWLESADLGGAHLRLVTDTDHAAMADIYVQMDVLVLPSRTTPTWTEQFGRVLVEALSCGTPVIGSDSGEIPWVINMTGGGETFPEGDDAALAARVGSLRANSRKGRDLAERGRQQVASLFSVDAVADSFEDALLHSAGLRPSVAPNSKPRVALVAHGVHDGGGMERACAELIRRARHQFDFDVVSADIALDLLPFVRSWTRVAVPQRPRPLKFIVFWVRAGRVLRRLEPDLIHTVGAILPNRVDVASIHFCHAGFLASSGRRASDHSSGLRHMNSTIDRGLALLAEHWSYRDQRLRSFAAVSAGVAEEVARYYPSVPCRLTPNGVDLNRFCPDWPRRLELRLAQLTDPSTTVALFVGGDWDRKGLAVAIAGLAKARSDGADVVLWVVGTGDRARFERLAVECKVGDRVRFHGVRHDTQRFYQAADVFLLPSAYEAFSLATLEAAACGLPLVIPAVSGARDLVGNNEGGLIVDCTVPSVAEALNRLARDAQLRIALGAEARQRVQSYTWERSATAVIDLYRSLLIPRPATRHITTDVTSVLQLENVEHR
jgi:UDP-glucose:(heptosyl)LPS alpha-1,3-glucosyltransferase